MASKRKTLKERLRQEIERARLPQLRTLIRGYREPDWSNERVRELNANSALTLSDDRYDAVLQVAFKKFGLDPNDPWDWRRLLNHLARIHFSPTTPRGACPKWDERRHRQFQLDVAHARNRVKEILTKHGDPRRTDDDVADYLIFTWPERYGAIQVSTLRKYITSGPPKGRR